MGINTDLNVDPYFDDYDETKQFNRVLFRPARAVQARELTQLQTILQNQVERFGSNIYKEGTILSGVNLTSRDDINYVKLKDSATFTDPTLYVPKPNEDNITYVLEGSSTAGSPLRAEILSAENGFVTQNPDLKTFYINYLNTGPNGEKQFRRDEVLRILKYETIVDEVNPENTQVTEEVLPVSPVVANIDDQTTGKSFGVSCEEGVIYQKGHFLFVENQFVVVSKYTDVPSNVSVGFIVDEFIRNSDQDVSLLDNASGFNNENAPGADRLQLVPRLVAFATGSEPDDFFTLIRFVDGEIFRIRDLTEFNVIGRELARRTYEESGNYVVNGLSTRLEQTESGVNALVAPGKAYVFGREIRNTSTKRLPISPTQSTQTKNNQVTSVQYEGYYTYNYTTGQVLNKFDIDDTRYNLSLSNGTIIGQCSIANVMPGRIYVYAIKMQEGYETTQPYRIGDTIITGGLFGSNNSAKIFSTGKQFLSEISNVNYVTRIKEIATSSVVNIEADATLGKYPLATNILGVNSSNEVVVPNNVSAPDAQGNITVEFPEALGNDGYVYYDLRRPAPQMDTISEKNGYVLSSANIDGIVNLGIPNVVRLLQVVDDNGSGSDVTFKFKLVNNQKDSYYDFSYLQLKAGEALSNNNLSIRIKYFERSSTVGENGYLTINSYGNINKNLIPRYEAKDGTIYNLKDSYDFRPYAYPINPVFPSVGAASPPSVPTNLGFRLSTGIAPSVNTQLISQQSYFLSRVDNVVIDEFGDFQIFKGDESESPSAPELKNLYALSKVFVPGDILSVSGANPVKITDVSNRTYTMKDIHNMDKKIDRLVETVSLSLLEIQAKDFFVDDGTGNNRFKTGILVDACRDLSVANVVDPEFRAAVDKTREVITPAVFQYPIDLVVSDEQDGLNFTKYDDVITIADTGSKVTVLEQKFATQQRNCVTNFYNYSGKAEIFPSFDVGYDTTTNPRVNIEIDIAEPILDLVDNIQELIPLTREEEIDRSTEFQGIRENRISIETIRDRVSTLTSNVTTQTSSVGNFISDFAMTPFVRSREVKIVITGLRPGSRHYFFFEETDVNAFVYPGAIPSTATLATRNVRKAGNAGDPVVADSNGTVLAIFEIPETTFLAGENILEVADVPNYGDFDSARTSYARVAYRAFNFEVGRTELSATTRSVDFNVESVITERQIQRDAPIIVPPAPVEPTPTPDPTPDPTPTPPVVPDFDFPRIDIIRPFQRFTRLDPIAQTFIVRASQGAGATCFYLSDIEVYFGKKSSTTGVTLEVREVENGYPSKKVVPFGRKHLSSSEVNVDPTTAATATRFIFDNPLKLNLEKEYCFVVIPDANSPDYLIWTAQVGDIDVTEGVAISNDWGDGVLFTSTNDSAWKSYQDEDIKFKLNRYDFQTSASYVNLVPNKPEFFDISNVVGSFRNDELGYMRVSGGNNVQVQKRVQKGSDSIVINNVSDDLNVSDNQYLLIEANPNDVNTNSTLVRIVDVSTASNNGISETTYKLDTPWPYETVEAATISVVVAGRVSKFNKENPFNIHLQESSVTSNGDEVFSVGSTITGFVSRATATIDAIKNRPVSYFQPQVLVDHSIKTASSVQLYQGETLDRQIDSSGNVYLLNNPRSINSTSNIVSDENIENDFIIRVNLSNNGFRTTTPLLDAEISMLNVYEYFLGNSESISSKYVSKEVVLEEGFEGSSLKVLLTAYRPAGTAIDVYARFVYPTNIDAQSDWIQLENNDQSLYSNTSNTRDYRQFEYDLPVSETSEFGSFQIKAVMRHMTQQEIESAQINIVGQEQITVTPSLFPHISDYRAISLL